MSEIDGLKMQYLEAVRLHLWYSGSKYSYQQGKASKDLAETYRHVLHKIHAERLKLLRKQNPVG